MSNINEIKDLLEFKRRPKIYRKSRPNFRLMPLGLSRFYYVCLDKNEIYEESGVNDEIKNATDWVVE